LAPYPSRWLSCKSQSGKRKPYRLRPPPPTASLNCVISSNPAGSKVCPNERQPAARYQLRIIHQRSCRCSRPSLAQAVPPPESQSRKESFSTFLAPHGQHAVIWLLRHGSLGRFKHGVLSRTRSRGTRMEGGQINQRSQIRNCWARDVWIYSTPRQTYPAPVPWMPLIFETLPRVLRQSPRTTWRARAQLLRTSGSIPSPNRRVKPRFWPPKKRINAHGSNFRGPPPPEPPPKSSLPKAAATDVLRQPPVFRAFSESNHDRGSASATCILTGQHPCGHAS
jgi:hypothetical protein